MRSIKAIAFLFACLSPLGLFGQADQSTNFTPPLAVYHGSDIDKISFPFQNLQVTIPLLQLKGRGLDFVVTATFNSQTWSTNEIDDPSGLFRTFDTEPGIAGGWKIGVSRLGSVGGQNTKCIQFADGGSCDRYVVYALLDTAEGSEISLGDDSGVHGTGPLPTQYWSNDGTYMRILNASWFYDGLFLHFIVPSLKYRDGVTLNQSYDSNHNISSVSLEDTNGNMISCDAAPTSCTDTVGRVVHFNWNANTGYLDSITYQDSSNTTQTISFNWTGYSLDEPWSGSGCDNNSPANCYTGNGGFFSGLNKITLPSGLSYSFEYITTSPGVTPGQLSKVNLPTGGYIRYTYGCSSGPVCTPPSYTLSPGQEPWYGATSRVLSTDGTAAAEKTWTYTAGAIDPTYGQAFTITDPLGNTQDSYFTWSYFCPPAPGRVDYKDPGGTVLKRVLNTIGADQSSYTDPFPGPFVGPYCNNPRILSTATILPDTNAQSQTSLNYTTFGQISDRYDYDWGSGQPGALLRHTSYQYLHNQNSAYGDLGAHIVDRRTNESIYDGPSGSLLSQTLTTYDSATTVVGGGTTPVGTSNIVQHDYAKYPSTNTVRGNPTVVSRKLITPGRFLATTKAYNDAGNLLQVTDPKSNVTGYSYADNYYNYTPPQPTSAFVTKTTFPTTNGVSHIQRDQYYFNTGLLAASCGENFDASTVCAFGLTNPLSDYTTYTYDWNGRSLLTKRADGGQTSVAYNEGSLPISITGSVSIDSSHNLVTKTLYDGLGRLSQTQLTSDPSGVILQDTGYDELGRKSNVSNPYRTLQDGSYGVVKTQYDALNRPTKITQTDGNTSLMTYRGPSTQVQDEGNGSSRASRITRTDALGRLVAVCEVTNAAQSGGGSPGPCNLDIAATGFLTTYQYDALNDLTGIQQGAVGRSFTYDSLSRLLTAVNPESGTTTYSYDDNGNVATRIRPAPNQTNPLNTVTTTYQYDALSRMTQHSYSDGVTPAVTSNFDTTSELGVTLTNTIGRLSAEYTTAAGGSIQSGHIFSYDLVGKIVNNSQCTPQNCPGSTAFPITYTYNLSGQSLTATNGVGTTFTYTYDNADRLASMTSSLADSNHPAALVSAAQYSPLGLPASTTLGSVLNESLIYDCRKKLINYSSAVTPGTPSQSTTNSAGCPNGNALALFTGQSATASVVLRAAGPTGRLDHGKITLTLVPFDLDQGSQNIMVRYREGETSAQIARNLATLINGDKRYHLSATVTQAGAAAIVELSSGPVPGWSNFSLFASVSSDHTIPSVSATVLRTTQKRPTSIGQLGWSKREAK